MHPLNSWICPVFNDVYKQVLDVVLGGRKESFWQLQVRNKSSSHENDAPPCQYDSSVHFEGVRFSCSPHLVIIFA